MKFHQPETEALVQRLAQEGRGAANLRLEPTDWDLWMKFKAGLSRVFWIAAGSYFLLGALAASHGSLLGSAWQRLIAGTVMIICAGRLGSRLDALSFRLPMAEVLRYLPVSGRHILEWGRWEALLHTGWIAWWSLLIAWSINGRPSGAGQCLTVLCSAALISVITFATAAIFTHPWVLKLRLVKLFQFPILAVVLFVAYGWISGSSLAGGMPAWLQDWLEALQWLLPTTWVHLEHLFSWAGIMAAVWTVFGFLWWWRRPAAFGFVLDQPWDIGWSDIEAGDRSASVMAETEDEASFGLPPCEPTGGWVERLGWKFLPSKDRALAMALAPVNPGWTNVWMEGAVGCVLLILLAWLQRQPMQVDAGSNVAAVFLWMGIVVAVFRTWPSSDQIPLATAAWEVGYLSMPVYAGLPAGVRDLLRISIRLTAARCVASMALAIPAWVGMALLTGMPEDRYFSLQTVPGLLVVWCLLGQILACLRIQERMRPRRGAFINNFACKLIMGFLIVIAVTAAVIAILHLLVVRSLPPEWPGWEYILAELVVVALGSRAMVEILCWQLRSGKMDMIKRSTE